MSLERYFDDVKKVVTTFGTAIFINVVNMMMFAFFPGKLPTLFLVLAILTLIVSFVLVYTTGRFHGFTDCWKIVEPEALLKQFRDHLKAKSDLLQGGEEASRLAHNQEVAGSSPAPATKH